MEQVITKQTINEFLQDKAYKTSTATLYMKHLEFFRTTSKGEINGDTVQQVQDAIDATMSGPSAKQAIGAIKKYLEWIGYYQKEVVEAVPPRKPRPQRIDIVSRNTGAKMPEISQEDREKKAAETAEKIKNENLIREKHMNQPPTQAVEKPKAKVNLNINVEMPEGKKQLPKETKAEETVLGKESKTYVMVGKAFAKICPADKEVRLTKDFEVATEVNDDQAATLIDEFGGRKVQVETRHILHYC